MSKILVSRTLYENLATLGDGLFGQALRLRVAHWALTHEGGTFFQGEVAAGVSYSASAVAQELIGSLSLACWLSIRGLPAIGDSTTRGPRVRSGK